MRAGVGCVRSVSAVLVRELRALATVGRAVLAGAALPGHCCRRLGSARVRRAHRHRQCAFLSHRFISLPVFCSHVPSQISKRRFTTTSILVICKYNLPSGVLCRDRAVDRPLLLTARPVVRQELHPHHRLRLGAPAHRLGLVLLRPPDPRVPLSRCVCLCRCLCLCLFYTLSLRSSHFK